MSDIVKKLRGGTYWITAEDAENAAATIERLTKENERLIRINADHCRAVNTYIVDNARQEDARKAAETRADSLATELAKVREATQKQGVIDGNRITSLAAELAQVKQERDEWQMQAMSLHSQIAGDVERQSERNYWASQGRQIMGLRMKIAQLEDRIKRLTKERDEAIRTVQLLQEQLRLQNEELAKARGALRLFQSYGCPVCNGDCASANPPVYSCPMQIARAALPATPEEGGK